MSELTADGVSGQVSCRVLKLARQPAYRWLRSPGTRRDLEQAYRANALHDAHLEDPQPGYGFIADEAKTLGESMSDRIARWLCRSEGWWPAFGKKKACGKAESRARPFTTISRSASS